MPLETAARRHIFEAVPPHFSRGRVNKDHYSPFLLSFSVTQISDTQKYLLQLFQGHPTTKPAKWKWSGRGDVKQE